MTIEERLKQLILSRYRSIRQFSQTTNLPYSTIMSVFDRGLNHASAGTVFQICDSLNIDANALLQHRIENKNEIPKLDDEQYKILCEINNYNGSFSINDGTTILSSTKTVINYLNYCGLIERIPDADVKKSIYQNGYSFYNVTDRGKATIALKKSLSSINPAFIAKYEKLNDDGKQRLTDYLDDLIAAGKYVKDETCCTVDQPKKSIG